MKTYKKIILFLLILCAFCSCVPKQTHEERTYEVTYEIVYPDKTVEYTDTFNIKMYPNPEKSKDIVYVHSSRGTNYISHYHQHLNMVSSTCPLRLISYKRLN